MKCGYHVAALLHPYRVLAVPGQHLSAGSDPADDRSPDEDRLHAATVRLVAIRDRELHDAAVDLAAVRIALDRNVHEGQAGLGGMGDLAGHHNSSRATAVNRLLF